MRSTELDLSRYDSDKIGNRYLEKYDPVFTPLADRPVNLLEVGVFKGGSLLLWKDYFPNGTISGIDLQMPPDWQDQDRVRLFQGSQSDTTFLDRVATEVAPDGFDVIIDDASHIGSLTEITFWHLFTNHLKQGGIYVIEDWGTGYWDDWHDGASVRAATPFQRRLSSFLQRFGLIPQDGPPSHAFGMVGFIKSLVDEVAAGDVSRRLHAGTPTTPSRIARLVVTAPMVFAIKA